MRDTICLRAKLLMSHEISSKEMKTRSFVLYLMAVLLCLSIGSCRGGQTAEDQEKNREVAGKNDSITKAEEGKEKDVIHRRTKAQYVIY